MQIRNDYTSVPQGLSQWYTVESEPGIAVAGDDYRFNVETEAEAEQVAESLAAHTDEKLTVVFHHRVEKASFQRVTKVERA